MEDIKKISYKPDIKYTDEYSSDISFNKKQTDNNDGTNSNDNISSEIEDLINQGDAIQNMIDKLPDDIKDIIKDHVDPIIDFVKDELKDKELTKVPVQMDWDYNVDPDDDPSNNDSSDNDLNDPSIDDPDIDDLFTPDDDIQIKKTIHKPEEIVEKEYVKNLYDLFDEYYSNLHNIVSNFWSTLLYSIMNKKSSEIDVIMNNILLSSSEIKDDKKHLLDLAIKAEIHRNMKLKYFSNNFDAEGSMKHLKQFKAIYELRLRYTKIEKNDKPVSRADQMSNNILKSMNLTYDNKYDKSYENLYRYLKSSNVILEDSLSSAAQSIRAKQTLIDTKGVK